MQLTGTSSTGAVTGTDTQGNTLTVASDISDGNGDRLVTLSGVANHALAVNDKITVTFPAASTYRIMTDEVSGVSTVDRQSAASGTGSAFSSGATGTTSRAGEFVFAVTGTFGGTSLTWNTRLDRPGALQRQHEHPRARLPDSHGHRQLHGQWHRQRYLAG